MRPRRSRPKPLRKTAISAAAPTAPSRVPAGEIGFSGLSRYGGMVTEEYNPDLQGRQALITYDRMRADGQVQALQLAVSLPIHSAGWYVEPADDTPAAGEMADFVEHNLFEGMSQPWTQFLSHVLLALWFGFVPFEKVFDIREGKVYLRKLAPRHPRTVDEWLFSPDGGIEGFVQVGTGGDGEYRRETIPIGKALVATWGEEFENPEGRSLLRAAYKHWYMKDHLYALINIACERTLCGVPVGTLPVGYDANDQKALQEILEKLRTHEAAAITKPPGYEVEWLEALRNPGEAMPIIEHHDLLLARCVLAQVLNLGATRYGSRNVEGGQRVLFLLGLNMIADWICDLLNRYVIPQLCLFNWPSATEFPRLTHGSIHELMDREGVAMSLELLVRSGLLTPDRDLEQRLREMWDLPDLPEDLAEIAEPDTISVPEEDQEQSTSQARFPSPRRRRPARGSDRRTAREQPERFAETLDFDRLRREMGRLRSDVEERLSTILDRQVAALAERAGVIVEQAAAEPALSRGTILARLGALEVPYISEYAAEIRSLLDEILTSGRAATAGALDVPAEGPVSNELRTLLSVQAQSISLKHAGDLLYALRQQVLDDWQSGLDPATITWNITQQLRSRASTTSEQVVSRAIESLQAALNLSLRGEVPS